MLAECEGSTKRYATFAQRRFVLMPFEVFSATPATSCESTHGGLMRRDQQHHDDIAKSTQGCLPPEVLRGHHGHIRWYELIVVDDSEPLHGNLLTATCLFRNFDFAATD